MIVTINCYCQYIWNGYQFPEVLLFHVSDRFSVRVDEIQINIYLMYY